MVYITQQHIKYFFFKNLTLGNINFYLQCFEKSALCIPSSFIFVDKSKISAKVSEVGKV